MDKKKNVELATTVIGFVVEEEREVVMVGDGRISCQGNVVSDDIVKVVKLGEHFIMGTAGEVALCFEVEEKLVEFVKKFNGTISEAQIQELTSYINEILEVMGEDVDKEYDIDDFNLMLGGLYGGDSPKLWKYEDERLVEKQHFCCIGSGGHFAEKEIKGNLKRHGNVVGTTMTIDLAFRSLSRAALNCDATGGNVTMRVVGVDVGFRHYQTTVDSLADFYWFEKPDKIVAVGLLYDWTPILPADERKMQAFIDEILVNEGG